MGSPITRRSVLSLFSGCGGLDLGFVQAGFKIVLAVDNWAPAVETYRANARLLGAHDVWKKSLALEDGEVTLADLPTCELILGGPPCQGFSFAGRQFRDDPRNKLYRDFLRIVEHIKPRVFLLENVRGMEAMALDQVRHDFEAAGYLVTVDLALATNFGVPQRRERLIVIGFRSDLGVRFTPPDAIRGPLFAPQGTRSILAAIGDLPQPRSVIDHEPIPDGLPHHLASHAYRPLPDLVQRFVRHIPNGGCFRDAPRRTLPERLKTILDNPARYRSPRLFPKPDPADVAQTVPADTNPSLGGVLAPDLVYEDGRARPVSAEAHTSGGIYTAPNPSRRFTAREAARLQSFPDDFVLAGSLVSQYRQIGNAVPVRMALDFAQSIMSHLVALDAARKPLARRRQK